MKYFVNCELKALGKYNFKGIFVRDPSIAVDKNICERTFNCSLKYVFIKL